MAVAAAALLGLAVTACSQTPHFDSTGGSGGASSGTGTGSGGHGSGSAGGGSGCDKDCGSCSKCAETNACATEFAACNAECQAILSCTLMDPSKVELCARPFVSGLLAFRNLATCVCRTCSATCDDCKLLSCLDGMRDGNEAAIDCGGSCQPCT